MPHEPQRCRHIHTDGRQCGSPALRHEKLCYHHAVARRPARSPLGQPVLPDPEDLHAVQRGLAELLRLVARELIDDKQAKRLFSILAEAGRNLARLDRAHTRQCALALAEARFAARYPQSSVSVDRNRRASPFVQATETQVNLVTELVDDPELGPIAPEPAPDSDSAPTEAGCPILTTASPLLGWASSAPQTPHGSPTPATPAELEAEAQPHTERRREQAREQRSLTLAAREITRARLPPEARLRYDAYRAAEDAAQGYPTPINTLGIHPQPLQNERSTPENEQIHHVAE